MVFKRPRSLEDDANNESNRRYDVEENSEVLVPLGSPSKRIRRVVSFPRTPVASRTRSTFTTPAKTPYPLRAYDSPSNPFGRKHTESLIRSLPPSTSFSKHLALRFQFVRKGIPNKKGGVHRVVQVPLSYTFVHLRCLLSYLFGGNLLDSSPRSPDQEVDHLFEIKKDVEPYSMTYKPGQIKRGQTWAKLSSTRDPGRWRPEEDDVEDEEMDEAEEEGKMLEEEHDDWEWKDEEDFTIAHAWPDGLNTERGMIYYHSRTIQIHITINSGILPRRRGSGNTPHIFSALGRVYLSPAPLPRVLFKPSPKKSLPTRNFFSRHRKGTSSKQELSDTDAEGDAGDALQVFDENHPFNHDTDVKLRAINDDPDSDQEEDDKSNAGKEDFQVELNPKKWNTPENAFAIYLRKYMGPLPTPKKPITLFDDDEEQIDYGDEALDDTLICTPGLVESLVTSSPPPGSSSPGPIHSSSPTKYLESRVHIHLPSPSVYSPSRLPNPQIFLLKAKYKQTPAPPRAKVHRMRIERVERRMEKSKRSNMLKLKAEDKEVDDSKDTAEENSDGSGDEKVDQLVDDEDDDVFVPPKLKPGEIWDPFGDEEEV